MPRFSFPLSAAVLAAAVGGMLAAQPPQSRKDQVYGGKTVSDWVKQLGSKDLTEQELAAATLRDFAGQSDEVAEQLLAAATDAAVSRYEPFLHALIDLGPAAVPALTRGLWSDDKVIRSTCLYALSRIGVDGRKAGPSIARLLNDPDERIRLSAVEALRAVETTDSIPGLTRALRDRDPSVRLMAAYELLLLGADAEPLIPLLAADMKHETLVIRSRAAVLAAFAPETIPVLVERLPDVDAEFIGSVAFALSQLGPAAKGAVPALKKKIAADKDHAQAYTLSVVVALWRIARDPDAAKLLRTDLASVPRPDVAVRALWRMDPGPETVAALRELLKSEKPELACAAAGVLGSKADGAIPLLGQLLAHKDPTVRAQAVSALNRLGPAAKEVADALRTAAKDEVPIIAFWATVALCRLDPTPEAVAAVAGYLTDREMGLRLDAADVLGSLGASGKSATPRLTAALADTGESLRFASAAALWRIERHPAALPAIIEQLRSPNPRVRALAAVDIGAVFSPDAKAAVPELVKRLFDPFVVVRSMAAEALGRIGAEAKDAAPVLLALLEGDEPGFVQSSACEALGLIPPADKDAAVAVLKRKLGHADHRVRIHAALALYLIAGDKTGEKEAERGLGSRSHHVRITAAEALWRMKQDARVVPLLVRILEDANLESAANDNERYMSARALGRIGSAAKPAVPELVNLVKHQDLMLAATAATALKAIDPDAAKKAGVK